MTPYGKLAVIGGIHLVVMFLLTFVLISSWDHFYFNINRLYMAILMVAPMFVVMLVMMRSMFPRPGLNRALVAAAGLVFVLVFWLARSQTPIGNEQFLRSMIPHHSSAILMCEEASITDPEIRRLCEEIVKTQKEEIAQMKTILGRY